MSVPYGRRQHMWTGNTPTCPGKHSADNSPPPARLDAPRQASYYIIISFIYFSIKYYLFFVIYSLLITNILFTKTNTTLKRIFMVFFHILICTLNNLQINNKYIKNERTLFCEAALFRRRSLGRRLLVITEPTTGPRGSPLATVSPRPVQIYSSK